jgi:hypothetical protein
MSAGLKVAATLFETISIEMDKEIALENPTLRGLLGRLKEKSYEGGCISVKRSSLPLRGVPRRVFQLKSGSKKRVLIYSHTPLWDVHHSGMVELAWRHSTSGDEVTILSCEGELSACPANPYHRKTLCSLCKTQSQVSRALYLPKECEHLVLNLSPRNLMLEDFESLEEFSQYKFGHLPAGRLALSQLVTDLRDCHVAPNDLNGRGKELIMNGVALYLESKSLLSVGEFDRVYVWNGRRDSDGPLLIAAQELGIPALAYISGGAPDRLYLAESLHSMENFIKDILEFKQKHSEPSEQVFLRDQAELFYKDVKQGTSSIPGMVWFGGEFSPSANAIFPVSSKRKLAIFSSSLWETINFPEWQNADPTLKDTYFLLQSIANDSGILEQYEIVIRWHPALRTVGENELRLLNKTIEMTPLITHILPSDSVNSYDLIEEADLILTTGSTISIEAAYRGKPTIVAGPTVFGQLGSTYSANSSRELWELLMQDLGPLSDDGAVLYGAWFRNFGEKYRFVTYNEESGTYSIAGKKVRSASSRLEKFLKYLSRNKLGRLLAAVKKFILGRRFRFVRRGTK